MSIYKANISINNYTIVLLIHPVEQQKLALTVQTADERS
jgi:hypothetical protein